MLLTRLYLRNFRVFEDEVDLELPPGLVGLYGPNGAGKSTLLESVLWTLWGRARTSKDEVRTAGTARECVTEVEFEHEGHLYLVRRTLTGAAAAVRAEAHCDGLSMAEGVRDTARYVHSVLGMDDAAFRASVFAEQKQLAAFSSQGPAERRRLVLQLLGVTPLDDARDRARRDARTATEQHQRLRALLPDLDGLGVAAADADAAAGAAEADAQAEEEAADAANQRAEEAGAAWRRLEDQRQEYDRLVVEGKAARAELDAAVVTVSRLEAELRDLEQASAALATAEADSDGVEASERRWRLASELVRAMRARAELVVPAEPGPPDEAGLEAAAAADAEARAAWAEIEGRRRAADEELRRSEEAAARSAGLSVEAACPLCGQELGTAFEQVQAHRAAEVADAAARARRLATEAERAAARARAAAQALHTTDSAVRHARRAREEWERLAARQEEADAVVERAATALAEHAPDLARKRRSVEQVLPDLEADAARRRAAASAAERLRGRLERRATVLAELSDARHQLGAAEGAVTTLRDKVRAVGFDPAALAEAASRADGAAKAASAASRRAQEARLVATRARERAEGEARRLGDARAQHARLADAEADARHLTRLAELLGAFRNTVVASVGPRLAVQADELFAELTDHEYDRLEVDADSYGIRISDGGRSYPLERFSGSEIDLANLALRVAISEHVRFQSGGTVGLLVLDEVFGPLDDDRTSRMLLALERLRGRFRQVLVVTHAGDIKDQLPAAVEVAKRPGRRAAVRLVNA